MTVELLPVPPTREADARNRAARTFWQGLGIDVVVGVLLAVTPMLFGSGFAFTGDYWRVLGSLAAKTAILTAVSYVTRKLIPPAFSPPREVKEVTLAPTATTTQRADKTPL